jgi:tetratricopeptide (TPR) repeat protein
MLTEVAEVDLAEIPQMQEKQRELLVKAQRFYERFLARREGDPRVQREAGRAQRRLGDIHTLLGEYSEAETSCRDSIRILVNLQAGPARPEVRHELARSYHALGLALKGLGKHQDAEQAFRTEGRLLREQLAEQVDADTERELGSSYYERAAVLARIPGCEQETEQHYGLALDVFSRLANVHSSRLDLKADHARTLNNAANWFKAQGRPEAEARYLESAKLLEELPARPAYRFLLARVKNNLGSICYSRKEYGAALSRHREAIEIADSLARDYPAVPMYQQELARFRRNLGLDLRAVRQPKEALEETRRALDIRALLVSKHNTPENRAELANAHQDVGLLLKEAGEWDAARTEIERAALLQEELVASPSSLPEQHSSLGVTYSHWARLHAEKADKLMNNKDERAHELAAATDRVRKAVEQQRRALEQRPQFANARKFLGRDLALLAHCELNQGNHAAAAEAALQIAPLCSEGFEEIFQSACFLGRCIAVAHPTGADGTCQRYGDEAIRLLRLAVERGYKDYKKLSAETDLRSLQSRDDFQKLLKELEEKWQKANG